MKTVLFILICFVLSWKVSAQMIIHDRAIVAQRERMVYKEWDQDKFYPKPNRILGVPTNLLWYMTWALHPNYPKTDRRPLSPQGEQTQRLALAAAMSITSDYYKKEADSIRSASAKELARISGAFSEVDPLYQLYYKKELKPLENPGEEAFDDVPMAVQDYLQETGALDLYQKEMERLAERYELSKKLDMERGQRILMYHRILQEMRQCLSRWQHQINLSQQVVEFKSFKSQVSREAGSPTRWKETDDQTVIERIIKNREAIR
jgi:hypothetical protein